MARQRSHSIEFKRQVAQEFIAGESLYALSERHDISRQLIRVWVERYEAGALDEDAQAADLLQKYEAKIVALERMVGRQALEIEFLKGALKNAPRPRSANTSVIAGPVASPSQKDAWSIYLLRHARPPHARADHRCGDENDLRRAQTVTSGVDPNQTSCNAALPPMLQASVAELGVPAPRQDRMRIVGQLRATLWFSGGCRGSGVDDCE